MSFFSWFKSKPVTPQSNSMPTHGLTDTASSPAFYVKPPDAAVSTTDIKERRQERREHLYVVVRDGMLRSGVLAASYKFKVLSLDGRGRQFLIMVDLLDASALPATRFMDLERLIVANASQQCDLQVKAVYWRVSESSTPVQAVAPVTAPVAAISPMPTKPDLIAEKPALAPAQPTTAPTRPQPLARPKHPGFEPIGQDEVQAFHQAVAAGKAGLAPAAHGELLTSGPLHASPDHGFEDTLLMEPDETASPLSKTQFGEL